MMEQVPACPGLICRRSTLKLYGHTAPKAEDILYGLT